MDVKKKVEMKTVVKYLIEHGSIINKNKCYTIIYIYI